MPNFLNHIPGLSASLLTALFLTGCFEDVPRVDLSDDDTDSSSDASTSSETSGEDSTDTSDETGDSSGETDETSGETDTGMPMDMGNPCDESATPQWVADQLAEDCTLLFGDTACMQDEALTRAQLIGNLMVSYAPEELLLCYEDPVSPSFADVPENHSAYDFVEQAYFLRILPQSPFFEPDELASVCWAEQVLPGFQNQPPMIAVVESGQTDGNLGMGVGPVLATRYQVCGTSAADHLDFPLTIVNNLDGDFTVSEATAAVQDVRIRCATPDGSGYIPTPFYFLPGGETDVGMLDCYSQSGDSLELQIQVRTSDSGQLRLGLAPDSIAVRGDGYAPLYNVQ